MTYVNRRESIGVRDTMHSRERSISLSATTAAIYNVCCYRVTGAVANCPAAATIWLALRNVDRQIQTIITAAPQYTWAPWQSLDARKHGGVSLLAHTTNLLSIKLQNGECAKYPVWEGGCGGLRSLIAIFPIDGTVA